MLTPLLPRKERPGLERDLPLKVITEGSWTYGARFIGYHNGKERWALDRTVIIEFERTGDDLDMMNDLLSDCVDMLDGNFFSDRTTDYGDGGILALCIDTSKTILREDPTQVE